MEYIRKHRQLVLWAGILVLLLAAVYVTAILKPGIWYGDTFLREEESGFVSRDGSESLQLQYTTEGARAAYQRDGEKREYRLSTKTRMTEIFEDGRLKFRGTVQKTPGGGFRFLNERGELMKAPAAADPGYPNAFEIYTWVMEEHHAVRGNPGMLILLGICAALLALDLAFPELLRKIAGSPRSGRQIQTLVRTGLGVLFVLLLFAGLHHF